MNIHPADCCSICSNDEWKIAKSRERHNTEEVDEFLTEEITLEDEIDEIEHTIKISIIDEENFIFEASSNLFDEKVKTEYPDEAIDNLEYIIRKVYT